MPTRHTCNYAFSMSSLDPISVALRLVTRWTYSRVLTGRYGSIAANCAGSFPKARAFSCALTTLPSPALNAATASFSNSAEDLAGVVS